MQNKTALLRRGGESGTEGAYRSPVQGHYEPYTLMMWLGRVWRFAVAGCPVSPVSQSAGPDDRMHRKERTDCSKCHRMPPDATGCHRMPDATGWMRGCPVRPHALYLYGLSSVSLWRRALERRLRPSFPLVPFRGASADCPELLLYCRYGLPRVFGTASKTTSSSATSKGVMSVEVTRDVMPGPSNSCVVRSGMSISMLMMLSCL